MQFYMDLVLWIKVKNKVNNMCFMINFNSVGFTEFITECCAAVRSSRIYLQTAD